MANITTDRLLLRPIYLSDAEDVHEYSKNPNVGPNAGWKPHEDMPETIKIMSEFFIGQKNTWGITIKGIEKIIGSIGFVEDKKRNNPRSYMLGYAIGERHWGKGYMTEAAKASLRYAFEVLGAEIISVYCYPFNSRSKKVITKCGFRYEGTLRKAEIRYDGVELDNLCFSLTKKEYFDDRDKNAFFKGENQ